MKTLYIECDMGAAGDMLAAALFELVPDKAEMLDKLNGIGLPGVVFEAETSVKCGITGTHMRVKIRGEEETSCDAHTQEDHHHDHDHHHHHHEHEHHHDHEHDHHHHHHHHHHEHDHHHHAGLSDIEHILSHTTLPQGVRDDALAVFRIIAEAESAVHGRPIEQIHFHEVGTLDAIADIAAVSLLIREISPQNIVVSPINTGSGQVRCAHGILPVPAPATSLILRGAPIYSSGIKGELCTPTGAALLMHNADRFGEMPMMRLEKIGCGMGTKDFEAANCVRAMIGESDAAHDQVCELTCSVDDMTPEAVGFALDTLLEEGALDVYTTPIGMKKSRPGCLITVLCREEDKERIARAVFKHTTTIGLRETRTVRRVLERRVETRETPVGRVRVKISSGCGVEREKYEHDDLARIARENNISIEEAVRRARKDQ